MQSSKSAARQDNAEVLKDEYEGMAVYCGTKAAVVALSKTCAIELAPKGPRVNTISPGTMLTGTVPDVEGIVDISTNSSQSGTRRVRPRWRQGSSSLARTKATMSPVTISSSMELRQQVGARSESDPSGIEEMNSVVVPCARRQRASQ
ncbi:SDR family oxidoreductase [Rhodococcus sp. NPDC004095]